MKRMTIVVVMLSTIIMSQDIKYVGSTGCKMCHNKEAKGAQYTKWEASRHAHAFETLKSENASQIVKDKGLETEAWNAPECLQCHTTGYGNGGYEIREESFWFPAAEDKAGAKVVKRMKGLQSVGCESCHGAGSVYKSSSIMKSVYANEIDGQTVGLKQISKETCIVCHNEKSPTFKPFNFEESIKIITHPMPAS